MYDVCYEFTVYLLRDLEPDRDFDLLRSLETDFRFLRYLSFTQMLLLRDGLRRDECERERLLWDLERERERDRDRDRDLDLDLDFDRERDLK